MKLATATWFEVEAYLKRSNTVIIPTGSIEQHGPIGLIGTDAICAETIALRVGAVTETLVVPCVAFGPAPFNLDFPGSLSVSPETYKALLGDITDSLAHQGFAQFYFLNGHGANIALIHELARERALNYRLKSWWDFDAVNKLRQEYYGDWEGMHATPSEVAITQATARIVEHPAAQNPPQKLTAEFIKAHAGDKHGPPSEHRRDFPDGRVGSHSALATPQHGQALIDAATTAISHDLSDWSEKGASRNSI